jgi:hypothetical protein
MRAIDFKNACGSLKKVAVFLFGVRIVEILFIFIAMERQWALQFKTHLQSSMGHHPVCTLRKRRDDPQGGFFAAVKPMAGNGLHRFLQTQQNGVDLLVQLFLMRGSQPPGPVSRHADSQHQTGARRVLALVLQLPPMDRLKGLGVCQSISPLFPAASVAAAN